MIHIRWRIFITDFAHHLLLLAAALLFLWAIFLSAVRFALPLVAEHPSLVEQALSTLIGTPITFDQLDVGWHKLQPEIKLSGVHIRDANNHTLMSIPQMHLRISLFSSLLDRKIEFGLIQVKNWNIQIAQNAQSQWQIIGMQNLSGTETNQPQLTLAQLFNGLSAIKHLQLQNSKITVKPSNYSVIILDQTNVDWRYKYHQFRIYGNTMLQGPSNTSIQFSSKLSGNDFNHNMTGELYLKINALDLEPWLNKKTWNDFYWLRGIAAGEVWLTWKNDHWENISSQFNLSHLNIQQLNHPNPWLIKSAASQLNLDWQPNKTSSHLDFRLNSTEGTLTLGKIFRDAMPYQALTIQGQWSKNQNDENQMTTSLLSIKTADADATGKLTLTWSPQTEMNMNLITKANFTTLNNAAHYLPAGIMPPSVTSWLDQAIVSGDSAAAEMLWRGPLSHFPFHDQTGTMQIHGNVKNVTLDYAKNWPSITHLNADLFFTSHGMHILATQGNLDGIALSQVSADIPEFQKQSHLLIHSQLNTDLSLGWQFLSHSPLKEPLSGLLEQTSAQGPMNLDLNIDLPLYENGPETLYRGNIILNQAQLRLHALPLHLTGFSGHILFDNHSLQSTALTANWLNEPWRFQLERSVKNPQLQLTMAGKAPVEAWIQKEFPFATAWVKGSAAFTGNLVVAQDQSFRLMLQSPLAGLGINFLDLKKTPETQTAFSIEASKPSQQALSMKINWQAPQGEVAFTRRNLAWNILSPIGTGDITAPIDTDSPWKINLQNLNLKNLDFSQTVLHQNITQIPPANIQLNNVILPNDQFDKLSVQLRPTQNGTLIKRLQLIKSNMSMNATGQSSTLPDGTTSTQLKGQLTAPTFSDILQAFNFSNVMSADKPVIGFSLNWPGNLWQFDRKNLSGHLQITTGQGIFVDISNQTSNKINLGRLFNILSIGDIPDYLSSKFKGLTEKGFPFSQINGKMNFQPQEIKKIDTQITGPVADVSLNGCVDLAQTSLNIVAQVQPHLTSSLPVLATFAAGPVVGAIGYLANKLLINPTVGKLGASYYAVQGNMHNPKTRKIDRIEVQGALQQCH